MKTKIVNLVFASIILLSINVAAAASSENIVLESRGTKLSGELFLPEGSSPTAAIVLVHGSGPLERMTGLARLLASNGFATLTYDKRGVGGSGGVYEGDNNSSSSNLDLLATDAVAAYRFIKDHDIVSDVPVGYAGISQAGWIIPIAATRSPDVSFIVLWSGPVTKVSEELRFSAENEIVDEEVRLRVLRYAEYIAADDTDPRESLRQLNIPGYWLFGGQDVSFSLPQSIEQLDGLIEEGHDFKYQVFPGYGHMLRGSDDPRFGAAIGWIREIVAFIREN